MAVAEMAKIKLMSVHAHKEKILDALYGTGCVEIRQTEEYADTFRNPLSETAAQTEEKYRKLENAVAFYVQIIENSKNERFYPKSYASFNNFFISYDEFIGCGKNSEEALAIAETVAAYSTELATFKSERLKRANLISALNPYLPIVDKFSDFKDTEKVKIFFGTMKKEDAIKTSLALSEEENVCFFALTDAPLTVVLCAAVNEKAANVYSVLTENGFAACPFGFDCSAEEKTAELNSELDKIAAREREIFETVCSRAGDLKTLKIQSDYYRFLLEKEQEKENFSCTSATFILEGYIPKENAEKVRQAVSLVSNAAFMEISDVPANETAPTLLKNNFAVRQTEFITDLYSTPNYREVDPNKSVFFFFMMFMGLIMADIGYGAIMIALGLLLAKRIKVDNGSRRLWFNIAFGGFFAIIFGVLFNSLFGAEILPFTILPSPVPSKGGQSGLMTILLGCLALGVVQIAFGYFMKALNLFKSGDIIGGIFDGLCWVLFFIGFVFAAFNFLIGYLMPDAFETMNAGVKGFFSAMTMPGLILTASSLCLAAFAAGGREKGFNRISKTFGTFYGLINIFSDILSYARLFGLMLSGMIIAQTFNDIGAGLFSGGAIGGVLGVAVILIGHTFNLAMGVLGAYIHDSRLQYIEYFGKFYTGEGNRFKPIGSDLKYVYVSK